MLYALGILIIALAVSVGMVRCESTRANEAERQKSEVQGKFDAYRTTQEDMAKKEKERNAEKETSWRKSNDESTAVVTELRRQLDRRVRQPAGPFIRPDGSTISEKACPGPVPDGAPRQPVPDRPPEEGYVPRSDYAALEERATKDALRVIGLQTYVKDVCLKE